MMSLIIMKFNPLILLLFFNVSGIKFRLTDKIRIHKGIVQGQIRRTFLHSMEYSAFRGIPYGKPPVGYLRFKPPEEVEPWNETYKAISEGTPCPHRDSVKLVYVGDEDCLNLNVYTPKINFNYYEDEPFPVMVWIHGGGFISGSINKTFYGPDFLIENDVVVVTINYRLGALGFLSLNHTNATGNAGLKDQLLALKWVQKNIAKFGGDPNCVTIFGHSAGAVSVDYHILSNASKGLFHRSISMSGSHLCKWGFSTIGEAKTQAFELGKKLGIVSDENEEKLLKALYEKSPQDLVEATNEMYFIDLPFKPTLEDSIVAGDSAFISQCPVNIYKTDDFNGSPHMLGFAKDEAAMIAIGDKWMPMKEIVNNARKEISSQHDTPFLKAIYSKVVTSVSDFLIKGASSAAFIVGIDLKQKFLKGYSHAPLFYYRMSYTSNFSVHERIHNVQLNGAVHEDDLAYIWYISYLDYPIHPENPFYIIQNRITRMWTNFAKFGHPTPHGKIDPLLNIIWPITGTYNKFLDINNNLTIQRNPIDLSTEIISGLYNLFYDSNECPILS